MMVAIEMHVCNIIFNIIRFLYTTQIIIVLFVHTHTHKHRRVTLASEYI